MCKRETTRAGRASRPVPGHVHRPVRQLLPAAAPTVRQQLLSAGALYPSPRNRLTSMLSFSQSR